MKLSRSVLVVTVSLSFLATSAQAELELCFDDQVAYDDGPGDYGLSWVTDYRHPENGGYFFWGQLDDWEEHVGLRNQAPLVDVHGVTGWRVPTAAEYATIFSYTGDCGIGDCTLTPGGWSNPPWWNANGSHLHTADCVDTSLTGSCSTTQHLAVHGESYDSNLQGEVHGLDWYSQVGSWLVQSGNVCPAAAVPSSGLVGRAVLAAVLMGLATLLLSATVLKHGKFKLPFGSIR